MQRPLLVLSAVLLLGADWPQWLGPNRDGRVEGTVSTAALTEVWRTTPGNGYSAVAIADGTAYTLADRGTDALVVAVDAATGAERWSARLDSAFTHSMGFHGPRSTPTVVGDHLVVLTPRGKLFKLSRADGTIAWTVDLVSKFRGVPPNFGYAASPLVSEGVIYLDVGGDTGLVALSLEDASVTWATAGFGAGYSSAVRRTVDGVDQILFFTAKAVVGVEPASGSVLWQETWTTSYDVNAATPMVVGDDQVFIASGYGRGGAMVKLSKKSRASEVLWKTKRMKNKMATSVLYEGHIYGFNESKLSCISAKTGEQVWEQGGFERGTLLLAGDKLVVLGEQCNLAVVEASSKGFSQVGETLQVLPTSDPCWTVPSVADGHLFVRNGAEMAAYKLD
jgi:outer membrane protein assembly factor BamB